MRSIRFIILFALITLVLCNYVSAVFRGPVMITPENQVKYGITAQVVTEPNNPANYLVFIKKPAAKCGWIYLNGETQMEFGLKATARLQFDATGIGVYSFDKKLLDKAWVLLDYCNLTLDGGYYYLIKLSTYKGGGVAQAPQGNFVLYVSNQSMALPVVDITIRIDDKIAVKSAFDVKGQRTAQHNWSKYTFQLVEGKHHIKTESIRVEASLVKEFEISGKHWAVIDYWYYPMVTGGSGPTPRQLLFTIQDKPIGFQ